MLRKRTLFHTIKYETKVTSNKLLFKTVANIVDFQVSNVIIVRVVSAETTSNYRNNNLCTFTPFIKMRFYINKLEDCNIIVG